MNNIRFSLPALFGFVSIAAAGLGALGNACLAVLAGLACVALVELAVAIYGARVHRGQGDIGAFCRGFALGGSVCLLVGYVVLDLSHDGLSESWITGVSRVTHRPNGWFLDDPLATAGIVYVCFVLLGGLAGGLLGRRAMRETAGGNEPNVQHSNPDSVGSTRRLRPGEGPLRGAAVMLALLLAWFLGGVTYRSVLNTIQIRKQQRLAAWQDRLGTLGFGISYAGNGRIQGIVFLNDRPEISERELDALIELLGEIGTVSEIDFRRANMGPGRMRRLHAAVPNLRTGPTAWSTAFDHIAAHKHSMRNYDEVQSSESCGCFHCGHVFAPSEIERWVDDGESKSDRTALCPKCEVDAVIGSASGYPVTAPFLKQMMTHWFVYGAGKNHSRAKANAKLGRP